jgi:hypothetical protein
MEYLKIHTEEEGETILPRKLTVDELKLWFNHKIMNNDYERNTTKQNN